MTITASTARPTVNTNRAAMISSVAVTMENVSLDMISIP
jgi:hypothetical protein